MGCCKDYVRQTMALTKKNFVLAKQNKINTCVQLFLGVFFLLVILIVGEAVKAVYRGLEVYVEVREPEVKGVWDQSMACTSAMPGTPYSADNPPPTNVFVHGSLDRNYSPCFSIAYTVRDGFMQRNGAALAGLLSAGSGGAAAIPSGGTATLMAQASALISNFEGASYEWGRVQDVMSEVQRLKPQATIIGFMGGETQMDAWLRAHENRTNVGIVFDNPREWPCTQAELQSGPYANGCYEDSSSGADFAYRIQLNSTRLCGSMATWHCNDPVREFSLPLQTAVDAALLKIYGAATMAATAAAGGTATTTDPKIDVSFSDMPHPDAKGEIFNVMENQGPTLFFILVTFNFVIQTTLILNEKQGHQKQQMILMGMSDSAYWTSWFISNLITNTIMTFLLIIFGCLFHFEFFLETAFGMFFFTFEFTLLTHTGLAFLISSLFNKASSGRSAAIAWFALLFIATGVVTSLVYPQTGKDFDAIRPILTLIFPPFGFDFAIRHMFSESTGASNMGMRWEERSDNMLPLSDDNPNAYWSIEGTWGFFVINFVVCTLLALYFEKVAPNLCNYPGQRAHCCFCLDPRYWCPRARKGAAVRKGNIRIDADMDEDVQQEARRVQDGDYGNRKIAIEISGLSKVFAKGGRCDTTSFRAVDDIAYAVDEGSLFVILGHNGAGKSTTFNMLTGLLPVTAGDATVFGYSVTNQMTTIQKFMGVCPQHDVLWDQLSGRQHLTLFAQIRGIPANEIKAEVDARLKDVLLVEAADQPAGEYSGGMKRRLSIAIALLGNPKVVYLDEPTTGMDPVTRRDVWDMIERAKKGRVIVLTTHSMEEADVLGDRVAIMSKGRLQAIGTSLHLKDRFGMGFRLTMLLNDLTREAAVRDLVLGAGPAGTTLQASIEGAMVFQLPRVDDKHLMVNFFRALEDKKDELGVSNFSVGLSTLEEVFLNLSEQEHRKELVGVSINNGGALVQAHAPKTVKIAITVPEGKNPGDSITLDVEGQHVTTVLPAGATSGTDVTLDVQVPQGPAAGAAGAAAPVKAAQVQVQFVVPEGKEPGDEVTVEAQGQRIAVPIPDGAIAGQEVTLMIEVPAAPAQAPSSESKASESAAGSGTVVGSSALPSSSWDGKARRVTFGGQCRALCRKNMAYQLKNPCAFCCVIFVPFLVMVMLVVAQTLLKPLIIDTLICGTDPDTGSSYKAEKCLTDSFNATCIASFAERTYSSELGMTIGSVNRRLNPNFDKYGQFNYLELGDYDMLPVGAATTQLRSELSSTATAPSDATAAATIAAGDAAEVTLRDWYTNFMYENWNSVGGGNTCEAELNNKFDGEIQCDGLNGAAKNTCQKDLRKEARATTNYRQRQNAGTAFSGFSAGDSFSALALVGACPGSGTDSTSSSSQEETQTETLAEAAENARLNDIARRAIEQLNECNERKLRSTLARFEAGPNSVKNLVQSIKAKRAAQGLSVGSRPLDHFTTRKFPDFQYSAWDVLYRQRAAIYFRALSVAGAGVVWANSTAVAAIGAVVALPQLPTPTFPNNAMLNAAVAGLDRTLYPVVLKMSQLFATAVSQDFTQALSYVTNMTTREVWRFGITDLDLFKKDQGMTMAHVCVDPSEPPSNARDMKEVFAETMAVDIIANTTYTLQEGREMVENMCAFDMNMDIVRDLQFDFTNADASPEPAFLNKLYDAIGGTERLTQETWVASLQTELERACSCSLDDADVAARRQERFFGSGGEVKTIIHPTNPSWTFTPNSTRTCASYSTPSKDAKARCKTKEASLYKKSLFGTRPGAFRFEGSTSVQNGVYNVTVFYNNSGTWDFGTNANPPIFNGNWHSLTTVLDNALLRHHTNRGVQVGVKSFPLNVKCNKEAWLRGKVYPDQYERVDLDCPLILPKFIQNFSILDFAPYLFVPLFLLMQMLIITNVIVFEKQNRLLIIMKMSGLRSSTYWLVTYFFNYVQYCGMVALIWIIGAAGGMRMVIIHDQGLLFLFFFIWGHVLMVFSFILSNFFRDTVQSAAVVLLIWLLSTQIIGFGVVYQLTQDQNTPAYTWGLLQLFPPIAMQRICYVLAATALSDQVVTMSNMYEIADGSIPNALSFMVVEWFVLVIILWYVENAVSVGFGVRKPPCFCCSKGYWQTFLGMSRNGKGAGARVVDQNMGQEAGFADLKSDLNSIRNKSLPAGLTGFKLQKDTEAEEKRVFDAPYSGGDAPAVRILKLHKRFQLGGACAQKREKIAVKSLSFGVNQQECFGLLGHNGAGKTTTLNMLCGMFEPTEGGAHVGTYSIRKDMDSIYGDMAVCPQHNILWDSLTAREHLQFFGRLKVRKQPVVDIVTYCRDLRDGLFYLGSFRPVLQQH